MRIKELHLLIVASILLITACSNSSGSNENVLSDDTSEIVCDQNTCESISIIDDEPAVSIGSFRGYADPHLAADPNDANLLWLSYSWLDVVNGASVGGGPVLIAGVENHLARSTDGGETFEYVRNLWPVFVTEDPEGVDGTGISNSETASLVAIKSTMGDVAWFGAHLRYFQKPETGYHPKYATSWTIRVGSASTPEGLTAAPESVLGVTQTAAEYTPDVYIDTLAGLSIFDCSMLNNPSLFTQNQILYLIVECLAFFPPDYEDIDFAKVSMHVFATEPMGDPSTWSWRHAGKISDAGLANELEVEALQQPDISFTRDGVPILIVTMAHSDETTVVGTVHDGCMVLELESLDPPVIARTSDGEPKVLAKMIDSRLGACTHNTGSVTGILAHEKPTDANYHWSIIATQFGL